MKRTLLSATSFLSLLHVLNAQTLYWSNEVIVANNSFGNVRPRIAVTTNNYPVVLWGGGATTEPLYTARWNGSGFYAPVQVTPNNVDPFVDTWGGPGIAARGNDAYVVFKRQPEMMNYIYIVRSTDAGMTWTDTNRVDLMNGPYDRFPNIEINGSGNPAVVFMDFSSTWTQATWVITNSSDGGQTFPAPVTVSSLGNSFVCDCCPAYLVSDNNRQIVTWRRNNSNLRDMWMGMSNDGGNTYTTGADVDNTNWNIPTCPSTGPDPFLNADTLVTVYMSEGWGDTRIYINTLNVTTLQTGLMTALAGNYSSMVAQNYPQISGKKDTMGVVWEQQDMNGNTDSYFTWSVNGASSLINNEMVLNNMTMGDQRTPDIAFSNGMFHMVFQDIATGNVIYKRASFNLMDVKDIPSADLFFAYPNPSSGEFMLSPPPGTGADYSVHVIDLLGNEILKVQNISRIDLSGFEKGVYFVLIRNEKRSYTQKIIIQ